MKIIITGALGHIGSKLIRLMPNYFANTELILIDNISSKRYPAIFNLPEQQKYQFIAEDILNLDIDQIIKTADYVVHLAAITDAANSFNHADDLKNNNLRATEKIASSCVKYQIPLIFPSSTSVYGSQKKQIDEFCDSTDLNPQSPYAECKLQEEQLLQNFHKQHSLPVTIFRLGTIFGTSIGMRFHTAVNKFCWQAALGKSLTVWKTAYEQKRPYLALDDAIAAIIYFIKNNCFNGEIYNIVTANSTVKNIINIIKEFIPTTKIDFVNNQIMNQLSYEVLSTNLNKTKFKCTGNLRQGIAETLELFNFKVATL